MITLLFIITVSINSIALSTHLESDSVKIKSGETASYKINLMNDETTPYDIRLEHSDIPENWIAEFNEKEFQMVPLESKEVYFYLTTPIDEDNQRINTTLIIWYKRSNIPLSSWNYRDMIISTIVENTQLEKEKIPSLTDESFPYLPVIVFSTLSILIVSKFRYIFGKGVLGLFYRNERSKKRNMIFNNVNENNGLRIVDIENNLGINRETIRNHLKRLEGKGQIIQGENKLYYPSNVRTSELTFPQLRVFEVIKENEGITPTGISKTLGRSNQFVNYHLTILEHKGYIRKKKSINSTFCHIV